MIGGLYNVDSEIWGLLKAFDHQQQDDKDEDALGIDDHHAQQILKSQQKQQQQQNHHQHQDLACPHCKSDDILLVDGNYTCKKCYTLVCRFIDSAAEWRYCGSDDAIARGAVDMTRCAPPATEFMASMGSLLGFSGSGGREAQGAMRIVQKFQLWNSMTHKERMLHGVFEQFNINAGSNGVSPCIIEEAKHLYKRVTDAKLMRGLNRQSLIASSIYMACKSNGVPRSVQEIASMFNIAPTVMTRGYKRFQTVLATVNGMSTSSSPDDFVARFCSKLTHDVGVRELCKFIVKRVDETGLVREITPPSIVAGALQLCNNILALGISRNEISEACHLSPVTLAKSYKKIADVKEHLLPSDVQEFIKAYHCSSQNAFQ